MKFLALDIETTGLDLEESQLLQLAAIYHEPGKEDRVFNVYIDHHAITYGEPAALAMNKHTFDAIRAGGPEVSSDTIAQDRWYLFLDEIGALEEKVVVAGKNAAAFDLPVLRNNGFRVHYFSHRVLDVGSLYLPEFGYIPSLSEINKKLNRAPVTHDAVQDCRDIVAAVCAKLGGSNV